MSDTFFELGGTQATVLFGTESLVFGVGTTATIPWIESFFATSPAAAEVATPLPVPAGAVVTEARLHVTAAAPANATPAGGIAAVRAAAGAPASTSTEIVVDFGVMRTVSGIRAPAGILSIAAWRGTSFDQWVYGDDTPSTSVSFTEVQTERLLVTMASGVVPATFAEQAVVTTTTPPADLELLVGGERVWTRPGPVPAGFGEDVDVTVALQAAVDRGGADASGVVAVPVVLRSRVPGALGLDLAAPIGYLRTHTVAFPDRTTTRALSEEGELTVPLPLPPEAAGWIVHRVLATVVATDDDPLRVLPPVGPPPTEAVELVLDPDRRLVVRIPPQRLAPFGQLAAIRLPVLVGDGGIEIGGAFLVDADGLPGEPLPKGSLTPLTLPPGGDWGFVTVSLPQPVEVTADAPLWLSLAATRGSASIGLGPPVGAASDTTLRRVLPNGAVRAMSSPAGLRTDVLRLRLVGIPPAAAPIDLVAVDLEGGTTVHEPVEPPLAAGGLVSLASTTPGPRPDLALTLTATAATSVTIGPVVVAYADPATGGS